MLFGLSRLVFFQSLGCFDGLLLSGRGAIHSHRHRRRWGPLGFGLLGRNEFALRNSRLSREFTAQKRRSALADLLRGLPRKKSAPRNGERILVKA